MGVHARARAAVVSAVAVSAVAVVLPGAVASRGAAVGCAWAGATLNARTSSSPRAMAQLRRPVFVLPPATMPVTLRMG
jgi:hypothetical protein